MSISKSASNFLPANPHRLPPRAKVVMIRNKFSPLTFHFSFKRFSMLQNCVKQTDNGAFFPNIGSDFFVYTFVTIGPIFHYKVLKVIIKKEKIF